MTRIVSTKLSNAEHEALLEMASLYGQSISEFIRNSIMLSLCGLWTTCIPDEVKIEELQYKNGKRFGVWEGTEKR